MHIISPIDLDGVPTCCTADGGKRTPALVQNDARESAANEWMLLEASGSAPDYETARVYEGRVVFGICCAQSLTLTIQGRIETKDSGYDWLRVTLNPGAVDEAQLYYRESVEPAGDPDDPADVELIGPLDVVVALPERPCGHVVEITASTGDVSANNVIWWQVGAAIT